MRKSQAPSFRGPQNGTVFNGNKNHTTNTALAIRSTENILNLIKGSESVVKVTPEDSQPCAFQDVLHKENINLNATDSVYNIVYGKQTKKKHKTWEGDGTLHVGDKFLTAKDENGKVIGTLPATKCKDLTEGTRLFMGNKEIEIIEKATEILSTKRKADLEEPMVVKRPKKFIKGFQFPHDENQMFILPEPSAEHQWTFSDNRSVSVVAVEPWLAKKLRPHQRKGISFLYECIMGFKGSGISGAILADEMGLGKTLQCIALVWTCLRCGPYGRPVLKRVLIVTPSSLTGNWAAEFQKWLGRERLIPYVIDARHKPQDRHPNERVVIISYEMLQRHRDAVGNDFDLLICDEAHRLKNADTKVSQALSELCISKRILLTGTPMQNDLEEFFALVDFANPNSVGNYTSFRRQYEDPIVAARQPEATEELRLLGEEQALELNQITGVFILRRTQSVLDSYLPGKKEVVVFCKPPPLQRAIYNAVIESLSHLTFGQDCSFHLGVISSLRKVASHPVLLMGNNFGGMENNGISASAANIAKVEMADQDITLADHSGKVVAVLSFLSALWKSSPRERVVLVSSFTSTLDMLEEFCRLQRYPVLRLDGSTQSSHRTDIVSRFNQDENQFVFLLSAKAGGVGLNLIGASRLVLFDTDWNPATDLQAMARIWRDGQRRQVYIYRFLTAGTIEEKMFQRQLSKQTLAGGIVNSASTNSVMLSREELKDIFLPCEELEDCLTHASLGCTCEGSGVTKIVATKEGRQFQVPDGSAPPSEALRMEELMCWEHYKPPIKEETLTDLKLTDSTQIISFMFITSC